MLIHCVPGTIPGSVNTGEKTNKGVASRSVHSSGETDTYAKCLAQTSAPEKTSSCREEGQGDTHAR